MMEYNPWCGISSYQSEDEYRFKGRETDVEKFLDIVYSGNLSVLYADSGIGKTSFINAGIIPRLTADKYRSLSSPILFPDELFIEKRDVEKWIIEQCRRSFRWTSLLDIHPANEMQAKLLSKCENSLWWFLHTNKIAGDKDGVEPVFYFDQFEDVFSKSRKFEHPVFLIQIFRVVEELSSDIVPEQLNITLNELAVRGLRIKVDRTSRFKIIFSLRKEYLADFDYWTNDRYSTPLLLKNRMLLRPLTRLQAEEVITRQPLKTGSTDNISTLNQIKDEIINLIDAKRQDEVEPVILSVLCHRLYTLAQERGKVGEGLSREDLNSIDLNYIIRDFYEESISRIITSSRLLRRFEEKLVDEKGYRARPNVDELIGAGFSVETLDALKAAHIIRTEKSLSSVKNDKSGNRGSGDERFWIELIHDRVAEVVRQRKEEQTARRHNTFVYLGLAALVVFLAVLTLFYGRNSSDKNSLVSNLVQCDDHDFSTDDTLWVDRKSLMNNTIVESFSIRDITDYSITDCPNLSQIDLRELGRDTLKLSLYNCPLLGSLVLPDSLSFFQLSVVNCPNLQIHINSGLNNFTVTSSSKLTFRVDKNVTRYEWYDKVLWDLEHRCILYTDLSNRELSNGPVRCRFPARIVEKSVNYGRFTFQNVGYDNTNEDPNKWGRSGMDFTYRHTPHDTIHRSEIRGHDIDFVILPDSMAYIEDGLFSKNSNLSSVKMPLTLEHIGRSAFEGCLLLKDVKFPSTLKVIDSGAFKNCRSLKEILIPENVTEIQSYAFEGCDELSKIVFKGDSVKIGVRAFANCPNLAEVELPEHYEFAFADYFSNPFLNTPAGKNLQVSPKKLDIISKSGKSLFVWPDIIVLDDQSSEFRVPPISRKKWTFDREPRHITDIYVPYPQPDVVINDDRLLQRHAKFRLNIDSELKGGITLHVPYGCKKYYEGLHDFSDFRQIEEMGLWETRVQYASCLLGNASASLVSWRGVAFLVLLVVLFFVGRLLVRGKKRNLRNDSGKSQYLWMLLYPIFITLIALAFFGWLRHILGCRELTAGIVALIVSIAVVSICYLREFQNVGMFPSLKSLIRNARSLLKGIVNVRMQYPTALKSTLLGKQTIVRHSAISCLLLAVITVVVVGIRKCGHKDWESAVRAGDYDSALEMLAEQLLDKDTLTITDIYDLRQTLVKSGITPQYIKDEPLAYSNSDFMGYGPRKAGMSIYRHDTLSLWYGGRYVEWPLVNEYGNSRENGQNPRAIDRNNMLISHYNAEKDSSYIFDMTNPVVHPCLALKGLIIGCHLSGPYYWMKRDNAHFLTDEKGRSVLIPPVLFADSVTGYKPYGSTILHGYKTTLSSLDYNNNAVVYFKDKSDHPYTYFFGCSANGPVICKLSDKDDYYSTLNNGQYLVLRRQIGETDEDGFRDRAIVICDINHNLETVKDFETQWTVKFCDGETLVLSDDKHIFVYNKPAEKSESYCQFEGEYKQSHRGYVCYKKDNKIYVLDVSNFKHHEIDAKYYSTHSGIIFKGQYLILYDNNYHVAHFFSLNDGIRHVHAIKANKFEDVLDSYYLKVFYDRTPCYYYVNDCIQAGAVLSVPTDQLSLIEDCMYESQYDGQESHFKVYPLRDSLVNYYFEFRSGSGENRLSLPIITGRYLLQFGGKGRGGTVYPMHYESVTDLLLRSRLSYNVKQKLMMKIKFE